MRIRRVKDIKSVSCTKFLSMYELKYENKVKNTKTWMLASRKDEKTLRDIYFNKKEDSADAVVIVAVHEDLDKLVIIKEYRVPINDYVYSLPAGLIDPGEDIYNSVKRELFEETGLNLVSINSDESIDKVYLSPGMTDESCAFVYCKCNGEVSKDFLEENEDIETFLIDKKEAEEMLKSNKKMDVKAYLILQRFVYGKL